MAALNEDELVIVDDYNNGIEINEYEGKYSLNATNRGKNDVDYRQWVFLSRWSNGESVPDEKKRPMSVRIGSSKEDAIRTLETLIIKLKGGIREPEPPDSPSVPEDDIPF